MPTFNYIARDLQGVDHKGTIETTDDKQVARILGKRGLIVILVKKGDESGGKKFFDRVFNKVSFSDLVVATRQLATMVESGLVLSESIDILSEQQSNKRFKSVLEEISRDIKGGMDLASSIRKHPDVFPQLYASLVKSGEQSGKLDIVLTQMATSLERDREFRSRIRGAMIYPVIIIIMMVLVVGVMMFFVVPRLLSLYSQSDIDLPVPTKILIATSGFFTNFWWMLLLFLILGIVVFRSWVSRPQGKLAFDGYLLRVPIVGKIIQGTSLTNFTRTFGLLTAAGIPILDALTIVADVIGNMVYKKALQETIKGVERGLTFSAQLQAVKVFPPIVPQMFRVGEETGKVDKVSFKLADYFEAESDHLVKNLTVVIEPIILVILGLGVAFLVLSIILPIYKLTTSIS
ncbi:type II secretion system F family protein [Candidatus Daviesbacteria bacterium]|nr:type II secretion system F family protein [Candidatus Daviesbacteria bacterium]